MRPSGRLCDAGPVSRRHPPVTGLPPRRSARTRPYPQMRGRATRRCHRICEGLPGMPETCVVLLITQRRLVASRLCLPAWPERAHSQLKSCRRRITSGVLPACARATCTDSTDPRTDGTQDAGIIRYAVPRTVPRPRRRGLLEGLDRCDRRSPGLTRALDAAGQPTHRRRWAASPNTYSDALCLALYAISAAMRGCRTFGCRQLRRAEQVYLARRGCPRMACVSLTAAP